jgi:hypothetical protein
MKPPAINPTRTPEINVRQARKLVNGEMHPMKGRVKYWVPIITEGTKPTKVPTSGART